MACDLELDPDNVHWVPWGGGWARGGGTGWRCCDWHGDIDRRTLSCSCKEIDNKGQYYNDNQSCDL